MVKGKCWFMKEIKVIEESNAKEWFDVSKDKMRVRIEDYDKNNKPRFISTNNGRKLYFI